MVTLSCLLQGSPQLSLSSPCHSSGGLFPMPVQALPSESLAQDPWWGWVCLPLGPSPPVLCPGEEPLGLLSWVGAGSPGRQPRTHFLLETLGFLSFFTSQAEVRAINWSDKASGLQSELCSHLMTRPPYPPNSRVGCRRAAQRPLQGRGEEPLTPAWSHPSCPVGSALQGAVKNEGGETGEAQCTGTVKEGCLEDVESSTE